MFNKLRFLNVFQLCKFLKFLGHVMVLLVLAIVGVSYYAVVATYSPMVGHGLLAAIGSIIVIIIYTILILLLLWSYFAAVSTDPGTVPPNWHPFVDEQQAMHELERMSYSDYYFDRRDPRRPRYCKRCQAWKPERAHHCSVSGRCVLKMDHYCIWVVNCVGLMNYKFFLLFLAYTFLSALTSTALLIKPTIDFFTDMNLKSNPAVFLATVIDGAFALSLGAFLVMHLQLIAANCTTIEMYEKDRLHPWPYNKGFRRNFEEVFGRNKWRWFLPFHGKEEKRVLLDSCLMGQRLLTTPHVSSNV